MLQRIIIKNIWFNVGLIEITHATAKSYEKTTIIILIESSYVLVFV